MKTIQKILVVCTVLSSVITMANDRTLVSENEEGVTITKGNKTVEVSILNVQKSSYTLYIYSEDGNLVFEENLGNEISLGKVFDFKTSEKGTYSFQLVSSTGENYKYDIKTGSTF